MTIAVICLGATVLLLTILLAQTWPAARLQASMERIDRLDPVDSVPAAEGGRVGGAGAEGGGGSGGDGGGDGGLAVAAALEGRLEELRHAVASVAAAVEELASRDDPAARVREVIEPLLREAVEALDTRIRIAAEDRVETLNGTLRRSLGEKGFADVEAVSVSESDEGETRVVVTARRDGMVYKGPVLLRGAKVVTHRLSPSYPIFP